MHIIYAYATAADAQPPRGDFGLLVFIVILIAVAIALAATGTSRGDGE